MQARLLVNWCEENAYDEPGTLLNVQLMRRAILDLLKAWVGVGGRGRADVVQITTHTQERGTRVDLGDYVPRHEPSTIVNVNPTNGNGKTPGLFKRLSQKGRQ